MATKLKFLNQFQKFDLDAFLKDKTIIVNGISQWKEFGSDKVVGTKIEVAIMKDGTKYVQKENEQQTNRFATFDIKVRKEIDVPINSQIISLVNPTAAIYGDYRNQLSVKCEDIKILQPAKQ